MGAFGLDARFLMGTRPPLRLLQGGKPGCGEDARKRRDECAGGQNEAYDCGYGRAGSVATK